VGCPAHRVKRLYLLSLLIFTIGSAYAGSRGPQESLIAFRVLQGIGGGHDHSRRTDDHRAEPPERKNLGRVMGVLSTPTIIAPIIGPTIGGLAYCSRWDGSRSS